MLKVGRWIARHRVLVLIIGFLMLIPSAIGYLNTRINYDILYYLPDNIETMQGQEILLNDFGKGAYALMIVNGMDDKQAGQLKAKMEEVDHVADIIWFDTFADPTIPQEILPSKLYNTFHSENGTLMAVFFDTGTSDNETMDAITQLRRVGGEQCFLSSMSAIVTDTRDLVNEQLFWYVLIAVVLSALVLTLTMNSFMAPVLFLANIGMAIVYNLGTNFIQGEISFITMSLAAVLQLAVTMDYSIFLWDSYNEQQEKFDDKGEAMAQAIAVTIRSVAGSSLTTIAGFIALCFMTFTLGLDLGIVMAKGVVFGVIGCVTILPSMMLCCDKLIRKTAHKPLNFDGSKAAEVIIRYNKILRIAILLLWIPALFGYNHVNTYYKLDASLPDYLPSVQANEQLAEGYSVSTVHMILADADLADKDGARMLREMENVEGVEFALGINSVLDGTIPDEFVPSDATKDLKTDRYQLMLISSEYEVATDEVNEQVAQLQAIMKKYDPTAMLIGEAPCTKDLIDITDRDFKVVNTVSIAMIFLLILFVLKSVSLPVILVLVIELAIYVNMGMSYYLGETLPFIASIVIGTVQLGATVDYAILMTNRYETERIAGADKNDATRIALTSCLPSIVTSALGFFASTAGVALYSDVDLIGSLCKLMARGALISMVMVLVWLPSLYLLLDGVIVNTSWQLKRELKKQEKKRRKQEDERL